MQDSRKGTQPLKISTSSGEVTTEEQLLRELKAAAKGNPALDVLIRSVMESNQKHKKALKELQKQHEGIQATNDKIVAENAQLTMKNSALMSRANLQQEMKARALQKSHVATLMVDPVRGKVVYSNDSADVLFGASVGTSVFTLFLNTLAPFAQSPGIEESVVQAPPEPYGTELWRRVRASENVIYERVFLETVMSKGPVDTVLVMQSFKDENEYPWILIEALEIERLNKDAMTGLYRREVAVAALSRELSHRERASGHSELDQISVIMMDIDDFKSFNSLYEYEGGDNVIKRIAGVIRSEIRPKDIACRWFSGDEFLVVLYGPISVATAVAERICRKVDALKVRVTDRSGREVLAPVSISVGVADRIPGDDWKILTQRAESELTTAKQGGKCRVSTSRAGMIGG